MIQRKSPGSEAGATSTTPIATEQSNAYSYAHGLRLRRAASWRLPVLDHSGRSDPWWYPEPGIRGYEQAAHHLLGHGLLPAPNLPALRTMYRCGGYQRRVAEVIAEAWELAG
jgi:hypothetical protein